MLLFILYVLFAHFIADFVLQSHDMAVNKSKDFWWLLAHVSVYTTVMGVFSTLLFSNFIAWWLFTVVTGILHLSVDFVTSRINARLWEKGQVHNFFVGVGADQFIHYACLFGLLNYL